VRNESGRSFSEPDTENVVRGPREGFIESAPANATVALHPLCGDTPQRPVTRLGNLLCFLKNLLNILLKILYIYGRRFPCPVFCLFPICVTTTKSSRMSPRTLPST
ncbi:MAG: spore germination protein, partial [Fibrobacter sp.]|nr:spore germination protein [Fibrobacter sp.]